MLRYYTYYSIGGYKDLYLGSSEDKTPCRYYLPLLPVLEESSKSDFKAKEEYEQLKSLPMICQLSDKDRCGLPTTASSLFSHAGYKLIYQHVEGSTYALALRDITCGAKDEMGRVVPFLIVVTANTAEDVHNLNVLAAYLTSYLQEAERAIASFIGYDMEKNGLRFKLAEFNTWLGQILSDNKSTKVVTMDGVIRVSGAKNKVALLILPSGINLSCAMDEQNLKSKEINSIDMDKVISKSETEKIISQLEKTTEELKHAKESNALLKKVMVAAGIGGFILGAVVGSCSEK